MKQILVTTACLYENSQPVYKLEKSCAKYGLDFRPYGIGTKFVNNVHAKIECMLDFLPKVKHKYILYTDGADSFFVKGYWEILKRFVEQYHKIIVAGSRDCYPDQTLNNKFPKINNDGYNYICAGQYMGETKDVYKFLKILAKLNIKNNSSDQRYWQKAFVNSLYDLKIDYDRRLFQTVLQGNCEKISDACCLHFGGGKGGSPNEMFMNECYNRYI